MPSLQGQIDQAWLEVKFVLKWPRNHYRPHDPYIYFNSAQPDLVLAFDRLSNLPERLLLGRPIVL
ncbi:MAG: hypothetical protein N3B16_12325 [Candidatus Aminicenantes bacterium]|nr:hypothetical protein [Candidatus Aminicenantes bacterium]